MKRNTLIVAFLCCFLNITSCDSEDEENIESTQSEWVCGTYNGHKLYTGPQGGCYYYNSNENKTYVDRLECNCK